MENLKSITEKLLFAEDKATEKYTEDVKKIEKTKAVLEKELKALNDMYRQLKNTEVFYTV